MAWPNRNPPRNGAELSFPVREQAVWELPSKGLPCKETTDMLGVGSETAQNHCHNFMKNFKPTRARKSCEVSGQMSAARPLTREPGAGCRQRGNPP